MTERLSIVSVCRALPHPRDPSVGIFVANRIAAMARQADVRVIQPIPYFPGVRPLPDWARAPVRTLGELQIVHAPMLYFPGIMKSADAMWLAQAIAEPLRRLEAERPVDVIDAHFGYPEGAACVRVARRLRKRVFITIRGFENEYIAKPGIGPQLRAAMRQADGCICVSHSLREMAAREGMVDERLGVIHNAIDAQRFSYGEIRAARASLQLPANTPLIVSVGHLVSRKRHHVLVEAFAHLRGRHPEARLVIIGARSFESGYPGLIESLIEKHALSDAVTLAGNLPPREVANWLRAADVFALGTAREGCCNAVLEALAVGAPVVTTAAGDNAYFVRQGVNGEIVPVDDVAAMALALERALQPGIWDRPGISRALHATVGSWDDVASKVLDYFNVRLNEREQALSGCGSG